MTEAKKLFKFFESKGLEIRTGKTVVGIFYDNLQLFSVSNVRDIGDGDLSLNITFNILKENKEALKDIEGVDITGTPILKGTSENKIIQIIKYNKLISKSKKLTRFEETQTKYELGVVENKDGKTIEYRKNLSTEQHIVDAVFKSNEYINKGLILNATDVVFDLGGNIGCFSAEIFDRVKKVIAFEPETVNFHFFQNNMKRNNIQNVKAYQAAVVGDNTKIRKLYLGKVPYYYSFLVKNGRKPVEVDCLNINDLMDKHKPTKMKIDIEGSELEVMLGIKDFGRVDQIIFEYNFDMNGDLKSDYENFTKLKKHLKKNGFDIHDMNKDLKRNWNMVFLVNR